VPVDDLASQLRPVTPEEWPAFIRSMNTTFGEVPRGPYLDRPFPIAELDRSLGLWDRGRVVATAGLYSLDVTVPGAVVPCAGVTWITVAPTHRRRGVLTAIMRRQLDEVHEQGREPIAALWAAEAAIYGRFGYGPAAQLGGLSGRTDRLALRPDVDFGTGRIDLVEADEYRASAVGIYDQVRRFVPGNLGRDERWWDRVLRDDPANRDGATERQYLLHTEPDGTVTGYAAYRLKAAFTETGEPDGTITVEEIRALTPAAYASLWRFLVSHDLMRHVKAPRLSADDPLHHLLRDSRALYSTPLDGLWVRLVDVDRALSGRRYPAPIDLVFEVRDDVCPWNAGRWRLWGHPSGASSVATDRDPDIVIGIEALSAAYLGGVSLATLQGAGRVTEVSPGAVIHASTAFRWPVTPWCPDEF
jgi:predicted acetyltransferase